ncbi:MAG: DEAD/DEAH box helicase family protein [Clostridia bacterium]|nr:DEAD/DEAH box helicase family protein [Clostridia bacterium]
MLIDFIGAFYYNIAMFENVKFNGTFRDYQQRVLDNSTEYLKDGKINIVAAPGSGKTVLGLELIVRLKEPCLILSPTTTIRNQWGDRFAEHFLNGKHVDEYISYDLKDPKPLTCVTYQALHAAVKKLKNGEDGEDFSSFEFFAEMERRGVKTVCLDEAHHLQNEWQKALTNVLTELRGRIKTIALTATPPYDAAPNEWDRYLDVCGEIDEEISVPELVRENSLCPHQDYIYFNYPTAEETAVFDEYARRAAEALDELYSSPLVRLAADKLAELREDYDFLYTNACDVICLSVLINNAGLVPDKKILRILGVSKNFPRATVARLESAVNFLIKGELLTEEEREECFSIFKRHGVCERGEVCLGLNEKLKKRLIASTGKLAGISDIVNSEVENRGENLRMLILTDYIKGDELALIGSDGKPDAVSVVSVFETVRRTGATVAALSGSLVILPDYCRERLKKSGADFSASPLGDTGYSKFNFRADNREKVRLVGELFESGCFTVLVGTKSLLGEGWDAPCVNSLILASFVGSFMLSNQMRGRAIRTDRAHADKTANIWHLVTVERPQLYADGLLNKLEPENKEGLNSCDYETVKRRFDCFVAPNYETGAIESGIERVTLIKPPYDKEGIEKINGEMLKLAAQGNMNTVWHTAVNKSAYPNEVSSVPKEGRIPPFLFVNAYIAAVLFSIAAALIVLFVACTSHKIISDDFLRTTVAAIAFIACLIVLLLLCILVVNKILKHISPKKSIATLCDCVLLAMKDAGLINKDAKLKVDGNKSGVFIVVELTNAPVHDKRVFHTAVRQLLSPIENPRYLLIPRGKLSVYRYNCALACPDVLGAKKEYADMLARRLGRSIGKMDTIYTRTKDGRKLIIKCRNRSYITKNENAIVNGFR